MGLVNRSWHATLVPFCLWFQNDFISLCLFTVYILHFKPGVIYLLGFIWFSVMQWQLYLHLARPESFSSLSTLFSSMAWPFNECMWKKSIMAKQLNQRPSWETKSAAELKVQYITDRNTEMWPQCVVDSGESVASSGLLQETEWLVIYGNVHGGRSTTPGQ